MYNCKVMNDHFRKSWDIESFVACYFMSIKVRVRFRVRKMVTITAICNRCEMAVVQRYNSVSICDVTRSETLK